MKDVFILVFLSFIVFQQTHTGGFTELFEKSKKEKKESDKEYQLRLAKEMAERLYGVEVVNGSLEFREERDTASFPRPARSFISRSHWPASDDQLGLPPRLFPRLRRYRRSEPVTQKIGGQVSMGLDDITNEDDQDSKKKISRINSIVDAVLLSTGSDLRRELGLCRKEGKMADTKILQDAEDDMMTQMSGYISSCVRDALKDSMGPKGYYPLPSELQTFLVWMMHGAEGGGDCPPGRPEVKKPYSYLFHDDKHKPQFSVCNNVNNIISSENNKNIDNKKSASKLYEDLADQKWRKNEPFFHQPLPPNNEDNASVNRIMRRKRSHAYNDSMTSFINLLDFNPKVKNSISPPAVHDDAEEVTRVSIFSKARKKCKPHETCYFKKPDKHWCVTNKDWQEVMRDDRNNLDPAEELEELLQPTEPTTEKTTTATTTTTTEDECEDSSEFTIDPSCTTTEECSTEECSTEESTTESFGETTCTTACTTTCSTTIGTTVEPCAKGKTPIKACYTEPTTKRPKTKKCKPLRCSTKCCKQIATQFPTCHYGKAPAKSKEGCNGGKPEKGEERIRESEENILKEPKQNNQHNRKEENYRESEISSKDELIKSQVISNKWHRTKGKKGRSRTNFGGTDSLSIIENE